MGGEFQVNTYTTNDQQGPSVSIDEDGDYVIVWSSYGSGGTDTDSSSIQGFTSPLFADGFESGDTSAWSSARPARIHL